MLYIYYFPRYSLKLLDEITIVTSSILFEVIRLQYCRSKENKTYKHFKLFMFCCLLNKFTNIITNRLFQVYFHIFVQKIYANIFISILQYAFLGKILKFYLIGKLFRSFYDSGNHSVYSKFNYLIFILFKYFVD